MRAHYYEERFGSFYLIEEVDPYPLVPDGKRMLSMVDQIAVAFDISMGTTPILVKHGSPEQVDAWVREARAKYVALGTAFANEMARGIRMVVFPKDFSLDEINLVLSTSGYLGILLGKVFPEALVSDELPKLESR